ncbi:MAG: type II toxin-antitoxin system VapC family toxin [Pleurocapsa sp.]
MKYLLDTDICIYWLKGKSTVRTKVEQVDWSNLAICVITATELYFGAYNSNKIEQNLKTAENFIQSITVLPLSNDTLKKFGQLKAQLRKVGTPVADFDLLIASVAIANNLILVTNNTRHYQRITGLNLENWNSE